MAADFPEAGGLPRPPGCLCVLCGLPAAGKSTLSRSVCSAAARLGWRSTVVRYDDLIPQQAFTPRVAEEDGELPEHTEWKSHRQAVLQCVEDLLKSEESRESSSPHISRAAWERCIQALSKSSSDHSQPDRAPLLFVLDDNFYYPSMRYEVFQLARKCSLSFCQVYLQCSLETCISRNQSRSEHIPTEVIMEMATRLESPNPQKNSWETKSIVVDTTDNLSECDIQRVMDLISSAIRDPLTPFEDNTEQKEADRQKCATSVVHQADQACRRLVSEAMNTARESQIPPERMRCLATQLNKSKAGFLQKLRKQLLQDVTFITEEDVDVGRVVDRAVGIFDQDKKNILMRIINEHL